MDSEFIDAILLAGRPMNAASTDSLMDALRRYRLLEPEQLDEAARLLRPCLPEPKALADELVRRGWLTAYQAEQLVQGRGKDLLLGSYLLLQPLGEGGMGQVFKARNWKLGKIVALKLIRKERIDSPDAVRRFRREVRALAALSHPNIVAAYDSDEINGACLLAMEYIEGAIDLAARVKRDGPLPVAEACEYVRQTALGLQHAHERGMVHRDIKPHNLLLTADGKVVKILDMGLARLDRAGADAETSAAVTKDGAVLGSPDYLSPEQAQHMHTVDIRADIYSLGCAFYYLLAGRPPFAGGAFFDKVYRHRFAEPEPLETLRPDVPPALAALVRKLMAKQPEDRCQTPAEVAQALAGVLNGGGAASSIATAVNPAAAPSSVFDSAFALTDEADDTTAAASPVRPRRRSSGRWLGYAASGGLSLLIGLGLIVLLLYHLQPPNQSAPARSNPGEPDRPALVVPPPVADPPDYDRLPPQVFEDFESGTYGDWTKTGKAFGEHPAAGTLTGQQPVSGYGGKYLVNSFYNGDRSVGTLISPEFTIRHAYIRFRIGGGRFPGKECINLMVEGRVERSATGRDAERLEWDQWTVKDLRGLKARIEIIDEHTGPWGHINIDDITFTNSPPH